MIDQSAKAAPMASAPMKYQEDGSVDWGNMWDTFCVLARDGGPPHRPTMLRAETAADTTSPGYQFAATEICRAVPLVCGMQAETASPGWIAINTLSVDAANWLCEAIAQEGVEARSEGAMLFVPCGEQFGLQSEVKNVVTAVAKTTHYYADHLPAEVKLALGMQRQLARLAARFRWRR